ncbi:unnamed protein product [Moneuplotes crassus]|uniref:Fungal lipase-type domain-containing protein n=1 Tax=Euplotes crassus TaxID=5936 RepID=A0AAD1US02_EUPCR|nr:unnamed protein product [Moneuplotes crassus]
MYNCKAIKAIFVVLLVCFVTAEYNEERAQDYMYVSALVYCPPVNLTANQCGAATISTNKRGFVYLYSYDNQNSKNPIYMSIFERNEEKEIVVAFSGTITTKQLINEFANSLPVAYDIHNVTDALVFEYFYKHYSETFRQGMLGDLQTILNKFRYRNYKIIFTGHSLGGALAMHAIADAIQEGLLVNNKAELWTFGQPRVGNQEFLDAFVSEIDQYYRVVNNKDIVAHVPPCITDLKGGCLKKGLFPIFPYHAPTEVFYTNNMTDHVVCSHEEGEDQECSRKLNNISVDDHKFYWGVEIGNYFTYEEEIEVNENRKAGDVIEFTSE